MCEVGWGTNERDGYVCSLAETEMIQSYGQIEDKIKYFSVLDLSKYWIQEKEVFNIL